MDRRHAWGIGLVPLLAAVAFLFPVSARAETVIGFDDWPAGTAITNQYHAQGVDFGTSINGSSGNVPVVAAVPAGEAQSDGQVADVTCPASCPLLATGSFAEPHSTLSVAVGEFDGFPKHTTMITLKVYSALGVEVGTATGSPLFGIGDGFRTVISIQLATPQIEGFEIDTNTGGPHFGIDDLTFDSQILTAEVAGPGSITGVGIQCPGTCSVTHARNATPMLVAIPDAGASFERWGGACAGQPATCKVSLSSDQVARAEFVPNPNLRVTLRGAGSGTVVSAPIGIACRSDCSAFFAAGMVKLTASAAQGSSFSNWGDGCAFAGIASTCTLPMLPDTFVTANFTLTPEIADVGKTRPADVPPKAFTSVAVDVAGNGSVTSSLVGPGSGSQALRAVATIRCGLAGFLCYATTGTRGARLILHAHPGPGQIFKGWSGACSGTSPTCLAAYGKGRTVSASFVSRNGALLSTALAPPRFHVGWAASVGSGALVVSGSVSRASALRLELRRPFGAPLLTEEIAVAAGHFRHSIKLLPGVLSRGARLFPGPFVVLLQGHSGSSALPRALQTVVLPAPGRGVVRTHFASASADGPPTSSVPAGGGKAFVHFRFQSQPRAGLAVTVSWYFPNGQLLGSIRKPNRAAVESDITSSAALPVGAWRADLRVGGKLVSSLRVRLV